MGHMYALLVIWNWSDLSGHFPQSIWIGVLGIISKGFYGYNVGMGSISHEGENDLGGEGWD